MALLANICAWKAFGEPITTPLNLSIYYTTNKYNARTREKINDWWKEICQSWGENFIAGEAPAKLGVFNDYNCENINTRPKPTGWSLTFLDDKKAFTILVKNKQKILGNFKFKPSDRVLAIIADEKFRDRITYGLLDQLPMLLQINSATYDDFTKLITHQMKVDPNFKLPDNYTLYRLFFDDSAKLWKGQVITDPSTIDPHALILQHRPQVDLDKSYLWAHNSEGRGYLSDEMQPDIKQTYKVLEQEALKGGWKNFLAKFNTETLIGARYGFSLAPIGAFGFGIQQTSFEAHYFNRKHNGIKFGIDLWPSFKTQAANVVASFEGQRFFGGVAKRFNLFSDSAVLELFPRLEVWGLKAGIPVTSFTGENAVNGLYLVDTGNAVSLGFQGLVDIFWQYFKLTGYLSRDEILLRGSQPVYILSVNYGVNLYTRFGSLELFNAAEIDFFGFYQQEQTRIHTPTQVLPGTFDLTASGFTFPPEYIGLGFAYRW